MKQESAWTQEIRQQMKKTRFYGQWDEEREKYEREYLKIIETLDTPRADVIRQYVAQLQKCEYHHIRTAYLQGLEDERARKNTKPISGERESI